MGFRYGKKHTQFPIIRAFTAENQQPQVENKPSGLSINIENADIGNLYMEYGSMVYRRCLEILKDEEEAQNTTHDLFANIQKLKTKGAYFINYPKTFFGRIAKNMSLNKKKRARLELIKYYDMASSESFKRYREKGEQGQDVWELGVMESGYDQVEAKMIVDAFLKEQDEKTRNIYIYKFEYDMTLEQIGEAVGLKKSAVEKRINKMKEKLRLKMEEEGK